MAGASTQRWRPDLPPQNTLVAHQIDAAAQLNARDCGIYALTFLHRLVAAILRADGPEGCTVAEVQELLVAAGFGRPLAYASDAARSWWARRMLSPAEFNAHDTL